MPFARIQHHTTSPLYGINEWRDKFSSCPTTASTTNSNSTYEDTLPLLLLPFTPSDIILPGQTTTLQFKQGKYIDIIDESLTSYESVIGLSILSDDGLLPYAVICEVIEDEFVMDMGYRGFSSMSVGVKAVGRGRRVMLPNNEGEYGKDDGGGFLIRDDTTGRNISFPLNRPKNSGRTDAQDDIHLGQFLEWGDDIMNSDDLVTASEYYDDIRGVLGLTTQPEQHAVDDRIQRYRNAYEIISEQQPPANTSYQLMAASWGAFAAASESDTQSSSIIIQALETRNVVERLRLGLAVILDSQMPTDQEDTTATVYEDLTEYSGDVQENTFQ